MSHPIACVSSRMLPVACVATHVRPHALLHASFTCQETPPRPHGSQHVWDSCVAIHGPLDVSSYALFADTATPRATTCQAAWNTPSCGDTSCFVDRYLAKWLTPRSDPLRWETSSFSVDLRDFDPSGIFLARDQSRIYIYIYIYFFFL